MDLELEDLEDLRRRAGITEQMVTDEDYVVGSLTRIRTRMQMMAQRNPQLKAAMDHLDAAIGELANLKKQGGGF